MKCDELEVYDMASNADLSAGYDHHWAYDKDEVDEAIAELKAEIENLKNAHDAEIGDLEDSHLEEITYLGMENYRLKEQIRKYKMMRAFYNADVCMKKIAGANSEKKLKKWLNRYERWIEIADKLK